MVIHAVISYSKVKKFFGVKTLKEVEEIISSKFEGKLEEIALEGSSKMTLWNNEGSRRYGKSYGIVTKNREDLKVVHELLKEVADKVELL